ncbi:MAG: mRNA splicing protein prp18 [Pleopsidium flavum]|nr:MAG: mRNA splicing protein prp18 [Pleopsidium flavum]
MDFKGLMSAEISKAHPSSPPTTSEPQKKYLKRADIEAQRQEIYLQEQRAIQREKEEKALKKRKYEEEETARNRERDEKRRRLAEESRRRRQEEEEKQERARRKRLGLPELLPKKDGQQDGTLLLEGDEDIADEKLVVKLRVMGEPTKLFGENHRQTLRRYRRLTERAMTPQPAQTTGPIPTTLVLVPEAEMKVAGMVPKDVDGRKFLFRQLASYFTMILTEWAVALAQRSDSVKQSFQGKAAYNTMVQSRENMRPLFKKFEKAELEDGILEPVVEIVKAAQERRYVDANDGYLTLSIGKAAWPIGVTMVGIHERSAREKLHESDKGQAHIMSDEVTRKFLQSIKRCLSFAQTRWPPDDQLQLMG